MVSDWVLQLCWRVVMNEICDYKTDNLPPHMTILSTAIPKYNLFTMMTFVACEEFPTNSKDNNEY